jgi:hypothetical protein
LEFSKAWELQRMTPLNILKINAPIYSIKVVQFEDLRT